MSLNRLRHLIPKSKTQRLAVAMLIVFTLSVSFVVSLRLSSQTKSAGLIARSGDLSTTIKDGKTVYQIELRKDNKDPIDLLVKKGEYVQFNSKDGSQHQIVQGGHGDTEHDKQLLDSNVFNADEAYLLQFNSSGKFEFHDNYDHDFTMTVIVYDPAAPTKL